MQPIRVAAPDGLTIAAYEWGNPAGPEILFVHGFCQSHLSWARQVGDPALAARFRMVAYDLRGHGTSDQPAEKSAYQADTLWAGDLAAVIAAKGLKRPVLVGWSYGGRIIADYLATYGAGAITGINYVNARCSTEPALFGPAQIHLAGMQSPDLAENIAATRRFLRACFERRPAADDFETMLAFNMIVPAAIRAFILGRPPETTEALARLQCPVLVTHGRQDPIILTAMAEFVARTVKGARLSLYDDAGHSPFFEDAPRFNAELAEFAGAG
jgi:pimeloyl-ACP methyl ester carboxylesterase